MIIKSQKRIFCNTSKKIGKLITAREGEEWETMAIESIKLQAKAIITKRRKLAKDTMRLRSIGNIHENKNKKRERLNSKSEKKNLVELQTKLGRKRRG